MKYAIIVYVDMVKKGSHNIKTTPDEVALKVLTSLSPQDISLRILYH